MIKIPGPGMEFSWNTSMQANMNLCRVIADISDHILVYDLVQHFVDHFALMLQQFGHLN